MSTLRISNIEAKSVPASATVDEKVKITNSSGDTLVFIDGKTSGITTVGINTTDSNITFDANSNVVVTGIITATKFVGTIEPTNLTVGGDLTIPDKIIHTGDTNTAIRFPSADTIRLETGGVARLTVDSNGNTLTSGGLYAQGDLYIADSIIHDGDTDTKLSFYNDVIALNTAGVERFRIHSDGTIGIGQSSKSSTVGAGGLDIQGNATNCIIEMGNPFPGFSGGIVPELRITATNSGHEVKFESIWGGDNALHPHLAFTGGRTHFYRGTNSDEIARFDADKFWIGTTTGQGKFEVYDGTIVHSKPSGGGTRNYRFVNNNTAAGDYGIQISSTSGGSTYVNHTELKAGGDVHIHDGNLVVASGHGIDFSATPNTGTSELFDDYEEGTFTPRLGPHNNHSIYENGLGKYTKIGNTVTYSMSWQNKNATTFPTNSRIEIWNLPFTFQMNSAGEHQVMPSLMMHNVQFAANEKHYWYTIQNGNNMYGLKSRDGNTWIEWGTADWNQSSLYFDASDTFFVN